MAKSIQVQLLERIVSALSYITFGFAGVIWIVISFLTKNEMSPFCSYNIYQSIFLSLTLYIISTLMDIIVGLLSSVPYIGDFITKVALWINGVPIFFGKSILGLIIFALIVIFALVSLMGRRPYIPFVSNVINQNFRR